MCARPDVWSGRLSELDCTVVVVVAPLSSSIQLTCPKRERRKKKPFFKQLTQPIFVSTKATPTATPLVVISGGGQNIGLLFPPPPTILTPALALEKTRFWLGLTTKKGGRDLLSGRGRHEDSNESGGWPGRRRRISLHPLLFSLEKENSNCWTHSHKKN